MSVCEIPKMQTGEASNPVPTGDAGRLLTPAHILLSGHLVQQTERKEGGTGGPEQECPGLCGGWELRRPGFGRSRASLGKGCGQEWGTVGVGAAA